MCCESWPWPISRNPPLPTPGVTVSRRMWVWAGQVGSEGLACSGCLPRGLLGVHLCTWPSRGPRVSQPRCDRDCSPRPCLQRRAQPCPGHPPPGKCPVMIPGSGGRPGGQSGSRFPAALPPWGLEVPVGAPQVLCPGRLHGDTAVNRGVSLRSAGSHQVFHRTPAIRLQPDAWRLWLWPPDPTSRLEVA